MALDASAVSALVDAELSGITDPAVAALIQQLRIPPRVEARPWDYSGPGQYPCWFVLEDRDVNIGVAYCEHGFGPKAPWGLLWLTGRHQSMGDDSGWFISLENAVRDGW
jgi:hypothetical protein